MLQFSSLQVEQGLGHSVLKRKKLGRNDRVGHSSAGKMRLQSLKVYEFGRHSQGLCKSLANTQELLQQYE